ncbi:MAG TPA: SRPBCC family protein, partial [Phycicoccus sp.]|nr:SRPBCC family protein [Phycicoccus sp.]
MTVTTRTMNAPAARVWNVLADGWLYPVWVVGATRMREVESSWPAPGAQLHHSFGVWPAMISDST